MKVYEYLLNAAREEPDKACLEFMGKAIPYAYLADQARCVAAGIRGLGIEPGDSVGLMLPNLPQFVSALYGALMNGNVVVPLNVLLKPPEIRYQVEDSNMRLIFVFGMFLPQVEEAMAEMADPPKVIVIG